MKSAILVGIFAITLASATDVSYTIAENTFDSLNHPISQASGTCRML